ncbi:hypothetical protein, conserved [Leishmania lindenbergi]|uniref:Uncharacterized protein n=1 Tax=Leishmania lindenbergi TaxID=651832 RepID=A0AAW3A969_9TRYP
MPLLRWRCLCWRGSLSAYNAVTTVTRPFSRSSLSHARPRSHKRHQQAERSRTAPHPNKKRVSPPQSSGTHGILNSQPHTGSQRFSSAPSLSSSLTMAVGEVCGVVASPSISCSTEEKERELLRYFGRGRCLYDTVPLQSASFALQRASCMHAQRVPLATLFPAMPRLEGSASLSMPTAASPATESPALIRVQSSSSRLVGKAAATAESPALAAQPTASPPLAHFAPSNPFVNYELQARHHPDWLQFRLLSARFSSTSDSNKSFGAAEVPLRDVCADMAELWGTACTTWEEAMRTCCGTAACSAACFPSHYSVCFLVCYVQTQQKAAVGMSMQRIAEQVGELARANYAPQLFRVVPIFIGMRTQVELSMDTTTCDSLAAEVEATVDAQTPDTVTYATGGLYTMAETVQCITRLHPHIFDPRESVDVVSHAASPCAASEVVYRLEPQVFLLSDSWLHVRSVADLFSDSSVMAYSASDSPAGFATASPASGWGRTRHGHRVASFVPESTRHHVHVIPAVVTDRLSQREERAIARYVWCSVQRQVSDHRTAAPLQPPQPSL